MAGTASVSASAEETGKTAGQVIAASSEVTERSLELKDQTEAFLRSVRAA